MELRQLGKLFLTAGLAFSALGLFFLFRDRIPGLDRLGKLPGDLSYESKNVKIVFPLATSILLSLALSLLFWLFSRK